MALDVRTLLFLHVVAAAMMAFVLWAGVDGRGRGLARWNVSLGALCVGYTLLGLRGVAPDFVTKILANAALLTGLLLQAGAIQDFRGRRPWPWLIPVGVGAQFAVLVPLLPEFPRFTAAGSATYSITLAGIAVLATRIEGPGGKAKWSLAAMNLAASLALAARALSAALDPAGYPSLAAPHPVQLFAFVMLFCATLGGSFAFLILHRDHAEAEVRRLAMTDALTGLLNRRAFVDQAERELARARRLGVPFAVLMLDLDHFKRVNDAHGHQAGDRVLVDFAARLAACLRAEDLVGRYGGEEFCAILPGATPERALEIGERIRAAVLDPALGGLAKPVSVSVGIAVCLASDPSVTLDHAIARADVALYDAKRLGRNRVAQVPCRPAAPALSLAA